MRKTLAEKLHEEYTEEITKKIKRLEWIRNILLVDGINARHKATIELDKWVSELKKDLEE